MPMMRYQSFDPSGCHFPRPRVSVLPQWSRHAFGWRRQPEATALLRAPKARFYSKGRYALIEACRLSGVGPATAFFAPAYHCRTMLDPAIRLGAHVVLYPLLADLQPDLNQLSVLLDACDNPPAALLVPHYFGFAQDLEPLLALCKARGMRLIEDCSHCLFLPTRAGSMGLQGHYSISSPYKFFAMPDGGVLWANTGASLPAQTLVAPPLAQQFKGLARAIETAVLFRRHAPGVAMQTPGDAISAPGTSLGQDRCHQSDVVSEQYEPALEHTQCLHVSRWAMGHTELGRLVERRRRHFLLWSDAVANLPNCHALWNDLAPDCVPYMFPLRIDRPDTHFHALKRFGLPVWRWDDMAVSNCAVAMDYRTHLLHLPCHQELTDAQMRWMTSNLRQILNGGQPPSAK